MYTTHSRQFSLSGNALKIIALVCMTFDHIGRQLFPEIIILQIIGRLAFPIFAYMIAEGCRYTKNRKQYIAKMLVLALGCQIVYFFAMKSLYQCILVTFSLSALMISLLENARKNYTPKNIIITLVGFAGVYILTEVFPRIFTNTDFYIDYGLWGVMLPVLVYAADGKIKKLIATAAALILIALPDSGIQWYSILSLLLLFFYNGERGKYHIKNLFYIYYPVHLAVIYVISMIM